MSQTKLKNLNLNDVDLCGEAKRKKQEFGGAELIIIGNACNVSSEKDTESVMSIGEL